MTGLVVSLESELVGVFHLRSIWEMFGDQLGIRIRWCFPAVQHLWQVWWSAWRSLEADLHGASMVVAFVAAAVCGIVLSLSTCLEAFLVGLEDLGWEQLGIRMFGEQFGIRIRSCFPPVQHL